MPKNGLILQNHQTPALLPGAFIGVKEHRDTLLQSTIPFMRPVDWVLRLKQAPHLPEIHVIGLGVAAKQKIAFSGIRDRTQDISNPKDRVLLLCSDIDIADVNIGRQFVVLEGIAEATGMSGLGQGGGLLD